MIGRRSKRETEVEDAEPKWFDDFDLRLGDVMRGERATLGKSLLDVQRDLRIKAAYIAAIENSDPSAFDTPGFIAGYVRSYARYLGMDPDKAFAAFCAESGFSTAHGMSSAASTIRKSESGLASNGPSDMDLESSLRVGLGYSSVGESFLSHIDPRAVGSMIVLVALIAGLGFGGWTVLNEVQRVQVAPVEHTPTVLAELDPLASVAPADAGAGAEEMAGAGVFSPPADALDRLYRPQALDEPVLVARDAPISTLDPASIGTFVNLGETSPVASAPQRLAESEQQPQPSVPQVLADAPTGVVLFAVRPAWVRVRAADGSIVFEKILEAGEEYEIPPELEAPTLQAGMSGSLYFEIDGELFGPAGQGTSTVRKLSMARADLLDSFQLADFAQDPELSKIINMAEAQSLQE
ncbi:helix-turn-helix domain-containing protein [Marimonas arenosa]|uniref:DUF4115 domain-containing protein n=1 Tax=Marimonas arenosa TaxID=1795305 RepID=A0AAE3W9Z4_9RHOB|nr:helix-turn-helix domain-containing protein [Marimonas arenosa]MDQ2089126.1 DUF4115 domain-containing protein [Marimonas arenosa]